MALSKTLAVLVALLALDTNASLAEEPAPTLSHLDGPLYLAEDGQYVKTNYLLYVGPSYVTLFGATWTPETAQKLSDQIKRVTDRPIGEVVDISPDPEWAGGNAYWKSVGAKVIAANVTCTALKDSWANTVANARKNLPNYPALSLTAPNDCKSDKFELQNGKVAVFYLGPSHTNADVFVYVQDQKVLDAGSIIKEQLGNTAHANLAEYPNTLKKLQAMHLDIKTVIAGHWSPAHGPDLIDIYLGILAKNAADR
jgi:metallo-beta-lactamase class B